MATSSTRTVTFVTLELTKDEAQTLATVLGYVGGDPAKSQRKNTDNIAAALGGVGIEGARYNSSDNPVQQSEYTSVIFKDNM